MEVPGWNGLNSDTWSRMSRPFRRRSHFETECLITYEPSEPEASEDRSVSYVWQSAPISTPALFNVLGVFTLFRTNLILLNRNETLSGHPLESLLERVLLEPSLKALFEMISSNSLTKRVSKESHRKSLQHQLVHQCEPGKQCRFQAVQNSLRKYLNNPELF